MKISKKEKRRIWKAAVGLSKKRGDSCCSTTPQIFNSLKRELLALKKWNGEEVKPTN